MTISVLHPVISLLPRHSYFAQQFRRYITSILNVLKAMQVADSSETSTHFYRLHQFVSQNTETGINYLQTFLVSPLSQRHFREHADINFRSQLHAYFPATLMRRFGDNLRKSVLKFNQIYSTATFSHTRQGDWKRIVYFQNIYYSVTRYHVGRVASVGIATNYGLDGSGSNPGGDEIFCPSRPALGPIQPPAKWVPGLSRGYIAAGTCCWPLTSF